MNGGGEKMDAMHFRIVTVVYPETDPLHTGVPFTNTRMDLYFEVEGFTDIDDVGAAIFDRYAPLMAGVMPFTCGIAEVSRHNDFVPDSTPIDSYVPPSEQQGHLLLPLPIECSLYFKVSTGAAGARERGRRSLGPVGADVLMIDTGLSQINLAHAGVRALANEFPKAFLTAGGCALSPAIYSRMDNAFKPLRFATPSHRLGVNRARRPRVP